MEIKINSYQLKVQGTIELPQGVKLATDYDLHLSGSIIKLEQKDCFDGNFDEIATFKPAIGEIVNERGETVKVKDMRNNSSKMRSLSKRLWLDRGGIGNFEEWHDKLYSKFFKFADQFADEILPPLQPK